MGKHFFIVGTFFGIQLRVDYSWFVIFLLVAWTVISGYLPMYDTNLSNLERLIAGLVVTIIFFAGLIAHEYAHSLVANHRGLRIKRITLFILGGASELQHEPDDAKTELLMTAAGPLTSLAIAGIFALLWVLADHFHLTALRVISEPQAILNFVIGLFNLVPAYPLDGGRLLRSTIWLINRDFVAATKTATTAGLTLSYVMMGLGLVEILYGDLVGGVWLGLIGFYLNQAARYGYAQTLEHKVLAGVHVSDVLNPNFVTVPRGTLVSKFLNDYVLRYKQYNFLVSDKHKQVSGIIEMARLPRLQKSMLSSPIDRYIQPLGPDEVLSPKDSAEKALRAMHAHNVDILPVLDKDELKGVVIRHYLDDYLLVHRLQ